jgi:DNA invertase Pin-like site-specific DNA recombinase
MLNAKKKARRCYGYIRVSTTKQVKDGSSIESQETAIKEWVERNGHKLVMTKYDAGVSGTLEIAKRPGLSELICNMKKKDLFVTLSMSRMGRNFGESYRIFEMIQEQGCYLVSVEEGHDTSTSAGIMTMQIMSSIAEMQARQISQYAKESAESFHRLERHTGGIPYGYKLKDPSKSGSGLIEDLEQQKVIQLIREMRKQEDDKGQLTSFNKIAIYLTEQNIPTPKGGKTWNRNTVTNIHDRYKVATKGRDDIGSLI